MVNVKKIAIFVGGMLFGSAGFKILASKDAKKVYTQTTAAVLRMKDCTMETVSRVQEEAGDILADAKAINEARAAAAISGCRSEICNSFAIILAHFAQLVQCCMRDIIQMIADVPFCPLFSADW